MRITYDGTAPSSRRVLGKGARILCDDGTGAERVGRRWAAQVPGPGQEGPTRVTQTERATQMQLGNDTCSGKQWFFQQPNAAYQGDRHTILYRSTASTVVASSSAFPWRRTPVLRGSMYGYDSMPSVWSMFSNFCVTPVYFVLSRKDEAECHRSRYTIQSYEHRMLRVGSSMVTPLHLHGRRGFVLFRFHLQPIQLRQGQQALPRAARDEHRVPGHVFLHTSDDRLVSRCVLPSDSTSSSWWCLASSFTARTLCRGTAKHANYVFLCRIDIASLLYCCYCGK